MMNAYRMFVGAGLAFALLAGCAGQATAVDQSQLAKIKLPPGFRISVYARVPGARSMAVAPELNAVFVSTRGPHLYAVLDRDGDHIGKTVRLIARDLRVANGIAYHNGYLYVAEQRRVMRYRPRPSVLGPIRPQVLYAGLPDKPHHGWRYAAVGPDLKLYVTVGAPCNVCKPTGLEGSVVRMNLNGSALERFASGVRNSVGIDFHPKTGEAFFTDNGADRMGDDSPPDELNHAPKPGLDFGFPYYGGGHDVTPPYRGRPKASRHQISRDRIRCRGALYPFLSWDDIPTGLPIGCLRRPTRFVEPHRARRLPGDAHPLRS